MPVIDTNFLIAVDGGDAEAAKLLLRFRNETMWVPSMVAVEYLTGMRDVTAALEGICREFTYEDTNVAWVHSATKLRQRLLEQGKKVRHADVWIAAFAHLHDAPVITRNARDFEAMGVRAITW